MIKCSTFGKKKCIKCSLFLYSCLKFVFYKFKFLFYDFLFYFFMSVWNTLFQSLCCDFLCSIIIFRKENYLTKVATSGLG